MTQPNAIQHTPECLAAKALDDAWVAAHPHYCKSCNGGGQFVESYDPSPAGVGLSGGSIQDISPCEECSAQGTCPMCGQPGLSNVEEGRGEDIGSGPCTFCGYKEADGGRPGWECPCEQEERSRLLYASFASLYKEREHV